MIYRVLLRVIKQFVPSCLAGIRITFFLITPNPTGTTSKKKQKPRSRHPTCGIGPPTASHLCIITALASLITTVQKREAEKSNLLWFKCVFFGGVGVRLKSDVHIHQGPDYTPASHSTTLHPLLHSPSRAGASSPRTFLPLSAASPAGRGCCDGGGDGAFSPTTASFFLCPALPPPDLAWMCGNSAVGRGLSEWMETCLGHVVRHEPLSAHHHEEGLRVSRS